jgi:hypothetical protein
MGTGQLFGAFTQGELIFAHGTFCIVRCGHERVAWEYIVRTPAYLYLPLLLKHPVTSLGLPSMQVEAHNV